MLRPRFFGARFFAARMFGGLGVISGASYFKARFFQSRFFQARFYGQSGDEDVPVPVPVPVPGAGRGFIVIPVPVVGTVYGILPPLFAEAEAVHGVKGKARATLPRFAGQAHGVIVRDGSAVAAVNLVASGAAVFGVTAEAKGVLRVDAAVSVAIGASGSAVATINGIAANAKAMHDPDEPALLAFLLAA